MMKIFRFFYFKKHIFKEILILFKQNITTNNYSNYEINYF